MKKLIKNNLILFCLPFLPVFFFLVGFIVNEDLSTGGAEWDFYLTWPIIMGYSNFNFSTNLTTHMPLHYMMLSSINAIFNNQYVVRLIYYFFSFVVIFNLALRISLISFLFFICSSNPFSVIVKNPNLLVLGKSFRNFAFLKDETTSTV